MSFDPTLIAPYRSGLIQYYKPFLIGNDAFVTLNNCYSWRGVIKKREGSSVLGRLDTWTTLTNITNASPPVVTSVAHGLLTGDMVWLENVATTNGTITGVTVGIGSTTVTTVGAHGMSAGQTVFIDGTSGITQQNGDSFNGFVYNIISVGVNTMVLNVSTAGIWIAGGTVYLGNITNKAFQITRINANSFSLQDLNSGANISASGVASSGDIYLPVVGTRIFLLPSTPNEQLIVFHPKRAYLFNTSTQLFNNISFNTAAAAILWGGTKDNFFYSSNYASVMWTTNNVYNTVDQPVGIRFYNGSAASGWADHQPQINATKYLNSSLIVIPYKGRLVCLNTTEGDNVAAPGQTNTNYYQRARWCQLGTPFTANAPTGFTNDTSSWREDIPGKGGFIDADTSERIVSAEIIQDTLIVGFQFSTWRLRYTGNEILPFLWERIDTQFGSEATFSSIPFDDRALMISRRGIVGASFNNVTRIDLEVPDFVNIFETGTNVEGLNRIHGVRDYQKRLVYWTFPDEESNSQTPNRILCFNYQDNTWSTFEAADSPNFAKGFTTLANYKKTTDNTWSTWTSIWDGDTSRWDTGLDQQNTIVIVAGSRDSRVWQIMNSEISRDNGVNYNFTITTNLINPYFSEGRRCKLAYYDLYMTMTDNGSVTVQNYTDDDLSDPWLIKSVFTNDNQISKNTLKIAKYIRVFLGMIARNHQITITLSPTQLKDTNIGGSDFEIQGIIFHTRMEGRIKQ